MKRSARPGRPLRSGQMLSHHWPQHVLDAAPYPIFAMDVAGRIVSWNVAADQLYGYSVAEAVGRDLSLLALPDHLNQVSDLVRRVASGQGAEFETELMQKDGTRLSVSLAMSPVRDSQGIVVGMVAIARDNKSASGLRARYARAGTSYRRCRAAWWRFRRRSAPSSPESCTTRSAKP
jgi:PAS domain S-box-containing protein